MKIHSTVLPVGAHKNAKTVQYQKTVEGFGTWTCIFCIYGGRGRAETLSGLTQIQI